MKRALVILFCLLLLTGCGAETGKEESTVNTWPGRNGTPGGGGMGGMPGAGGQGGQGGRGGQSSGGSRR